MSAPRDWALALGAGALLALHPPATQAQELVSDRRFIYRFPGEVTVLDIPYPQPLALPIIPSLLSDILREITHL